MIIGPRLVEIHGIEKLEIHMNIQRELILVTTDETLSVDIKDPLYPTLYFNVARQAMVFIPSLRIPII